MMGDVLNYLWSRDSGGQPRSLMSLPIFVFVVTLINAQAYAREQDGRLGLVLVPNNARPALVEMGDSFAVLARSKAEMHLTSVTVSLSIKTTWLRLPNGFYEGVSELPAGIPAGTYALESVSEGAKDTNHRSVFVYEKFPETYRVVHLANLRIGSDIGRDTGIYQSTKAINEAGAAIVLVTGDLTSAGTPKQFAQALDMLNDCRAPTLVCPGPVEIASGLSEEYLGPTPFALRFGPDGYLGYYTSEQGGWDPEGSSGRLHRLRRSIRSARWSVGFTNRYDPDGSLRDHLVLFRDNPLDVLICALHPGAQTSRFGIPWGDARGFAADGSTRGAVQFFDVSSGGVHLVDVPRPE